MTPIHRIQIALADYRDRFGQEPTRIRLSDNVNDRLCDEVRAKFGAMGAVDLAPMCPGLVGHFRGVPLHLDPALRPGTFTVEGTNALLTLLCIADPELMG